VSLKQFPAAVVVAALASTGTPAEPRVAAELAHQRHQHLLYPDAASALGPAHSDASSALGPAHPPAFFDARRFTLSRLRMPPLHPAPGARGLIVPHHWLAGHLILAGLRDLAAGGPLRRVVLLAPNHIGAGGALVTTSDRPWETPLGRVEPDAEAVRSLVRTLAATLAPDWLTHEHSINGLMPALASELPGVRVVPLAIHSGLRPGEVQALARALAGLAGEDTVFVASVDCSHYLAPEDARIRDGETLAALRALDSAAVLGFSNNEHLDSPGSIAILMETMRLLGATRFELRANTNSAELMGKAPTGVTSYIYGLYR
jgi:AmmeMemoRadiSam system protein B